MIVGPRAVTNYLKRNELVTTQTLLSAIAAEAKMGVSRNPTG